jgi:DNA-binding IclR family transcriptional regulator
LEVLVVTSVLSDVCGGVVGVGSSSVVPPSMVERMTLILDAFGAAHTRLTLEEVTVSTGLPRSTTHRILEQLVRLGWLDHRGRDYALGPRALGLGGRQAGHAALRAAAFPSLQALAVRTEMVVHLGVLDGAEVYYLDKVGGQAAVSVPSRVGGRLPAHCTAVGKAMLAWLAPEQVDGLYAGGVAGRTVRSIGQVGLLHQELARIRARSGLAIERGECFASIGCVGAAVRGPDGPVGAVSIAGDVGAGLERLAPLVIGTANAIGAALLGEQLVGEPSCRPSLAAPVFTASHALGQLVAMAESGAWF